MSVLVCLVGCVGVWVCGCVGMWVCGYVGVEVGGFGFKYFCRFVCVCVIV